MRKIAVFLCLLSLLIGISGCATTQPTIKEFQQKVANFWKKLKTQTTTKQTSPRERALKKYGLKGIRESLIVESPVITPKVAKPGSKARQEVQFVLLSPEKEKHFKVCETIILSSDKDRFELVRRTSEKAQGIHLSTIEFALPRDLPLGKYRLITLIGNGLKEKSVTGTFLVKK